MYNIGVDLGGTNIAVGLVDEKGNILLKKSCPTESSRDNLEIIKSIATLCFDIMKEYNITEDDINSIGVGSPGTCDFHDSIILNAYNLGFKNVNLGSEMKKYFNNTKILVENDANCVAYGEFRIGVGAKYNSAVAITLGTGLGGGVIIDGKIISGSFYCGGEMGHMVLSVGGNLCTCGRRGCWESYSSATALIKDATEAARKNKDSIMNKLVDNDLSKMNAKIPFDAAKIGDEIAQKVLEKYYIYLSEGIANIINILEPEIIVIGGGISAQGDYLIKNIKKLIVERTFGQNDHTIIEIATLGNDAGIIGAAFLSDLLK